MKWSNSAVRSGWSNEHPDCSYSLMGEMKQRSSEIQILEALKEKGYDANMIVSGDRLFIGTVQGNGIAPEDCTVEEEHRFEGMSNPSDMAIVYAVRTNKGKKGAVVVNYGPNVDTEAAEFFRKTSYAESAT